MNSLPHLPQQSLFTSSFLMPFVQSLFLAAPRQGFVGALSENALSGANITSDIKKAVPNSFGAAFVNARGTAKFRRSIAFVCSLNAQFNQSPGSLKSNIVQSSKCIA